MPWTKTLRFNTQSGTYNTTAVRKAGNYIHYGLTSLRYLNYSIINDFPSSRRVVTGNERDKIAES